MPPMLRRYLPLALPVILTACAHDQYQAAADCAHRAGCVSSFESSGYGPVHAQAVAPDSPTPLRPHR